jgi:hypothetical protein
MRTRIAGADGSVEVLSEPRERLQVALDKTFGLTHRVELVAGPNGLLRVTRGSALPSEIPAFSGLREAYVTFTGDTDVLKLKESRLSQTFSTFSFPNALANTMNGLLAKGYGEVDYRWRDIVTTVTSPSNFKTLERSRVRFVGDLEELAEDQPYEEVSDHGDEKFTYAVATRGKLLTITRRANLADNVQGIERSIEQLARAAARTLAKRVWDKVISNQAYGVDSLPVFHTDHGNLGAAALSVASLNAARLALFAQTEPGSDERLGLSGPFLLAVPIELEATAREIKCEHIPGSLTYEGNAWYQRFGAVGERIFANPLFSDAGDWYLFDISRKVGILEVGFLMGRQMPELFVADDPRADSAFSQDRVVYKMRHEYEAAIEDYRGSYKAVAA